MAKSHQGRSNRRQRRSLREAATEVVRLLVEAGHIAYFAGGCVRDRLMGNEPTDYDVATSARPEEVRVVFPGAQSVGEAFGVMLVRRNGHMMEVATFRTDGDYADSRHPEHVTFSDARHDAARRDFTINGLFEDPLRGEIIDYVGGQADLEAKVIRAIGDAASRLREDHLRMLRAVRFAARFRFTLEEATADAIRAGAAELKGISRERIGQEVKRMLSDPHRTAAASQIQQLGLDGPLLLEEASEGPLRRLRRLPEQVRYPLALAAWLLDRHEGPWERGESLHPIVSRWGEALILSNDERAGVQRCLEVHQILSGPWQGLGIAEQKRLAAGPWFEEGLLLLKTSDEEGFAAVNRRVGELEETSLAPPPLIDGRDLIGMGLTPGPIFRRVLDAVYDAQLEGTVANRRSALELAALLAAGG
ncbi:MAG: CCA tRNA nucleotidyltransferase [Phycisphaerales bacterium]|nr:MAG: CCA tRNA nucleotidyltransferase [Phycisphaerales bacterium]